MICIHFPGKQGLICIFDGSLIRFRMPSSDAYRSSSATRLSSAERRISSTAATTSATAAYSSEKSVAASSSSKHQVGITGDVGDCVNLFAFRICLYVHIYRTKLFCNEAGLLYITYFTLHGLFRCVLSVYCSPCAPCFFRVCIWICLHEKSPVLCHHSSWRRRLRPPCWRGHRRLPRPRRRRQWSRPSTSRIPASHHWHYNSSKNNEHYRKGSRTEKTTSLQRKKMMTPRLGLKKDAIQFCCRYNKYV